MRYASHADFVALGHLIGVEYWHNDDWLPEMPVERAKVWRALLVRTHIAQVVLKAKLEDRLHWNDNDEGTTYRRIVSDYLDKKYHVIEMFNHAIDTDTPVKWRKE